MIIPVAPQCRRCITMLHENSQGPRVEEMYLPILHACMKTGRHTIRDASIEHGRDFGQGATSPPRNTGTRLSKGSSSQ